VTGEPGRHRAVVPPVSDGRPRPLWSVVIPTFNCARYLRETLAGVLAQDAGADAMQIEVIDDHSSDDPRAVVEEVGRGRVHFFRQTHNVGLTRNFHTGLTRARGHLIHLLHGDDRVLPGFYAKLQAAFASRPDIGAAFCRQVFIDGDGKSLGASEPEQVASGVLENGLERLALEQRIMTPSIVVKREAYEKLGAFDARLICAEDWEMWVRVAAHYPVWYEVEPLAAYRMHVNSNTGRHTRSADDMRYTRMAIDLFTPYLPPDRASDIARRARATYALAAIRNACALLEAGDRSAVGAQLREALALSRAPRVMRALAGFAVRSALRRRKA
jgi:glycosyltransferase involved in cell wall biosynthesis